MKTPPPVYIYPIAFVTALVEASENADYTEDQRLAEIDRLTDVLAQRGYCRPRSDASMVSA